MKNSFSLHAILNHVIDMHRNPHHFPENLEDWGYYLAGLIDSDGSFTNILNNQPNLTICFHIKDISLAYKIKSFIHYGTVSKIKTKNACTYVLTNKLGFFKLLPILFNKIKQDEKLKRYFLLCQHYNIILPPINTALPVVDINNETICNTNLLNNWWFAGFIDGDGSFQIKIINKATRTKPEIRLQLQIELQAKNKYLLDNILNHFGGNLGFRKKLNSYYYNSTNFVVFEKLINYFERFSLCSNKYKEYILWRKCYFLRDDFVKIQKIKKRLSQLKQA
jgi:hypothetical protein